MSDGASATVVMSAERARAIGAKPLARFVSFAVAGCPPEEMGIGPVFAIPKALKMAGLALDKIDVIELNEAFATQALSVIKAGGLDRGRVNPNGGAVALGHPLGCTGAKLTASILRRLSVFDHFPDEHGFFLRFLELIKEKEEEYSDLNSFLEHFEDFENDELFVNVVNSDAIKILTTHKAKGLEFPVVIIPFLGIRIHAATGGETGQQSYIVDTEEVDLKLLRIKQKYLQFSPKLAEIDRVQRVKSFISELNNTYVALTRAGKELYAFIPPKIGSGKNLIRHLIPPDLAENGKPNTYPVLTVHQQRNENQLGLPVAGDHDWINFLKEEFNDSASVLRRLEIRRGAVLHNILSGIGNLHQADQHDVIAKALQSARSQYPQISDWKTYEHDIQRIVSAPALKHFFSAHDGEIFLEKELINSSGQTRRVDRLIVKKDEIWIVDYKSSLPTGVYGSEGRENFVEQVKEYAAIIREIQPQARIKGFILYLDDAKFEDVL